MVLQIDPATGRVIDAAMPSGTTSTVLALYNGRIVEALVETGSSGVPAGSVVTSDSTGLLEVQFSTAETANTPTEAQAYAIAVSSAETSATPTEAQLVEITQSADTATAPSETRATTIRVGATTAAAANTAGSGWTNPTNAQGLNDSTSASANSASGLSPANQAGVLTLTFATIGTLAGEAIAANPVLTVYAALTVASLGTGSLLIEYSTNGGGAWTTLANVTATNAGPFTATLNGFSLTNVANLRVRATCSVTGSALGASTATLDAAVLAGATT